MFLTHQDMLQHVLDMCRHALDKSRHVLGTSRHAPVKFWIHPNSEKVSFKHFLCGGGREGVRDGKVALWGLIQRLGPKKSIINVQSAELTRAKLILAQISQTEYSPQ